jgi:hypothetical protein
VTGTFALPVPLQPEAVTVTPSATGPGAAAVTVNVIAFVP